MKTRVRKPTIILFLVANLFSPRTASLAVTLFVPPCSEASEGSCVIADDGEGNSVYVWGVDTFEGDRRAHGKRCIHEWGLTRLATKFPAHWLQELCTSCDSHIIVPMDVSPLLLANDVIQMHQQHGGSQELDPNAVATLLGDVQLHQYKSACSQLHSYLGSKGVLLPQMEGSTSSFLEKLRLLRRLALEVKGGTVCEVGFNAGHSSLMWLTAGVSRVISFELGQYPYSGLAAGWILERFPGRLHVVLGDSLKTVPAFHKMFPKERCDLVFVDGGHLYPHASGDIKNMRLLANESAHILIVDDTNQGPVARAWGEAIDGGIAREEGSVRSRYSEVLQTPFTVDLNWDGTSYREDEKHVVPDWESSLGFGAFS